MAVELAGHWAVRWVKLTAGWKVAMLAGQSEYSLAQQLATMMVYWWDSKSVLLMAKMMVVLLAGVMAAQLGVH